ncbi:hypothetical protein BKA62DRAFT_829684 [Auriculariales sp. MPI-PUGE-AT-0066]|nr:hypothetical protein BKA62DRAFT_829684 [Auriculariales sp. MPI-PUGE-AT-0066]
MPIFAAADAVGGPPLPAKVLNEVFGPLLIGTWLNAMFFMIEIVLLWSYFSKFSGDRLWVRVHIVLMFLLDITATVAVCALAYAYCVTGWGDLAAMQHQNFNFTIYASTSGCIAILMHGFLIRRYLILSKNWLVSRAARFDRPKQRPFTVVWLAGTCIAYVLIALALVFELSRIKSSFGQTQTLIRRLVRNSIMSGVGPAVCAIVSLATFLPFPNANICLVFALPLGRICTVTVLYNLHQRGKGVGATTEQSTLPLESRTRDTITNHHPDRIGVHQISVVHVDTAPNADRSSPEFGTDSYDKGGTVV